MRLLIVEDDVRLASVLAKGLRRLGLVVDTAADGDTGLEKALVTDYDVIVLDRNLPGRSGDEVCRVLREQRRRAGVLMLTAAGTVDDRVAGLRAGADDYLPKPFAFAELVARVHALSRRSQPSLPPVLTHDDLELDPARRRAARAGRELDLTNKEFGVLEVLLAAGGRVVSSEELLDRVWDEHVDPATNIVRVTVMTLRRKLGEPQPIATVVGRGYRL
ncbi:response regulator transcription factor [Nitriliruptoraceae bacterium ZYF776]|nr:response regulator transcription factor [Profundirhabdus halotolerans]